MLMSVQFQSFENSFDNFIVFPFMTRTSQILDQINVFILSTIASFFQFLVTY